jgi:cytochrome c556
MRRLTLAIAAVSLMSGVLLIAQKPYPVFTADDFSNAMKALGRNYAAVNSLISKNDFDGAKSQLARTRELLATTITFWRDRKKDDAIKMLRDDVSKLDDLDAALSAEKVDPAAVNAIVMQAGSACQSCHAVYREQNPNTKEYRFKAGLVHDSK